MVSKIFFSSNLVGRIFFPLLNALQDIFSPPHLRAPGLFGAFYWANKIERTYGHLASAEKVEIHSTFSADTRTVSILFYALKANKMHAR